MAKKYSTSKITASKLFILLFCLFNFNVMTGQNKTNIQSAFNNYVNLPREVAFSHLNKSLYLKGETIGFSVYILDKNTKKPSAKTTNIYAVIKDEKNNTIKEQLIWAKEGKAYGTFSIDSTFTNCNYTFKAYSNWMKNFDEQNLYSQSIKIIDPNDIDNQNKTKITSALDAQFLPEGGHLVANTENTVGVIIKDTLGYGVPYIMGRVLDHNNMIVSNFKTNHLGIGKFLLLHDDTSSYTIELDFRNRAQTFDLSPAEPKGINVILNQIDSKVVLTFNTNTATLASIKNKPYTLFIHNGSQSNAIPITFDKSTKITKAIAHKDLFTGINIFTLFNENNRPILERVFFNYDGIEALKTDQAFTERKQDSLSIQVPVNGLEPSEIAQLSISVLPGDTKSYNTDHNILSYTLLQPYVKGYIENAKYYFTAIDMKKQYELDNLLLTQGWSSYEWNNIFNNPPKQVYEFDTGLAFVANTNSKEERKYILQTSKNHDAQAYVVNQNDNTFNDKGFIIEDDDQLEFSEIIGRTKMEKPNLYLQFAPSTVPSISAFFNVLPLKENSIFEANTSDIVFDTQWNTIEKLDEVQIKANIEKKRINELNRYYPNGKIDLFDDEQRIHEIDLETYLNKQGYITSYEDGQLSIKIIRFGEERITKVYLNKQVLLDIDVLLDTNMNMVDYIIMDRTQTQYDAAQVGLGGTIHIKIDPRLLFKNDKRKAFNQRIKLPLTFTSSKTFYAPKYVYYDSNFFREYGVIDWFPNVTLNQSNAINLKVLDTKTKQITLFIEGVTNEGRYISEEKVITITE
jgi:hypothetical protein